MWKQITSKRFWFRVARSFLFYLVIYSLVTYAMREKSEPFWTLKQMQNILGFTFFMSVIFAYRQKETVLDIDATNNQRVGTKWSVKDFFVMYGLFLLFSIVVMSILFISAWLVLHFVFNNQEFFGNAYLKMILITATMSFLAVVAFFLSDRFGIRWQGRSTKS